MAFWFWLPWGRWALVLGWVAFPPWPSCGSCPCSLQGFGWGLVLLAFLFLVLWCLPISLDQPVEADSKADRRVLYLYEELTLTLLQVKIHTTGLEKLPQEGRFLLVCNHLSLLDPLILHIYTKKSQLAFISKRENDRLFIVNKLMHKLCASPSTGKTTGKL